ncbi:pyrrolysine--tRNA(Pyl) ligase large subunit [bacterium]|nr:pyrrolysine--tRNA(Pyl) ligase large subunit [bacterium]
MNDIIWTEIQSRRLKELGIDIQKFPKTFPTILERNQLFQQLEKQEVKLQRSELSDFLSKGKKTHLEVLKEKISLLLHQQGFVRVSTPMIITKSALEKMTIDENHPLYRQIYWLNEKQCLRPMLAPNLYSFMKDFGRLKQRPIRFFEMGSCFRNESDGAKHNSEFTMLNLVEMGLPKEKRLERLKELGSIVTTASGITDFCFEKEGSEVYDTTIDVVVGPDKLEVASGAIGPHFLDTKWDITDTWVGIGFGVERLLMASQRDTTIGKWGKSLSYFNGVRLKI